MTNSAFRKRFERVKSIQDFLRVIKVLMQEHYEHLMGVYSVVPEEYEYNMQLFEKVIQELLRISGTAPL